MCEYINNNNMKICNMIICVLLLLILILIICNNV